MIQSLFKMSEIIEQLMETNDSLSVNDFADQLTMPKSTIFRFLKTMETIGFVRRSSENGKFSLGLRLFSIGTKAFEDLGLRKVAIPYMESLRDKINESVLLTALQGTRVTYLDKIECDRAIVVQTKLGGLIPPHCVASGKAMIAFHPDLIQNVLQEGLQKFTKFTITAPDQFLEECAKIRELGYAIDNDEFHEGVTGIGAPIFNASGEAVAAISIALLTTRTNTERKRKIAQAVVEITEIISHDLGAREIPSARTFSP